MLPAVCTTGRGKQHHSDTGQQQQHQHQVTALLVVTRSVTVRMKASAVLMKWTVKMGMRRSVKMTTWQGRTTGITAVSTQKPWRYVPACRSVVQGAQQGSLCMRFGLSYAKEKLYVLESEQTSVHMSCCSAIQYLDAGT